jgi:predicted nucleotidyltransferase
MGIDERFIEELVRRVVQAVGPERIILFGSAAEGRMTRDSDIDLLVLKKGPVEARRERALVREALRGLGYAFDIIVMATERFEESRDVVGGIAYPADKHGRVIYEAA